MAMAGQGTSPSASSSSSYGSSASYGSSNQHPRDLFMPAYCLLDCAADDRDPYKCMSACVLDLLCIITLIFVVVQCVLLLRRTGRMWSYKHFLMYIAIVELVIGVVHYSFVSRSQGFSSTILYLELSQYVVSAYYFCVYALRVSGNPQLVTRILRPAAGIFFALMTAALVAEICVYHLVDYYIFDKCVDVTWLIFTTMQLVLAVVYIISGFYLTKGTSTVLIGQGFQSKRRLLMGFVIFYIGCFSCVLLLQIILAASFTSFDSCMDYFDTHGITYTFFEIALFLLSMYIPTWVVIIVFYYMTKEKNSYPTNHPRHGVIPNHNYALPESQLQITCLIGNESTEINS
ncbi:hypothetical protein Pelo_5226 [Pelomyxa schiedti]|nr:hypothetical protein Pelo_5226 [Pelomyxa schiedti]